MPANANRPADGDLIEVAGARVRLKVNGRARRVGLRLDRAKGEVVAVAPTARRLNEAVAFARQRQDWILEKLGATQPGVVLTPGMELVFLGRRCRLGRSLGRASLEADGWERGVRLSASADAAAYEAAVVRLMKREALEWFLVRRDVHCHALQTPVPPISIMDARTRWGSCTPAQQGRPASIRLSWRLALAPLRVADYVVAHECAHLLEANHGPNFWAHVRRLVGDERPHRKWLRTEGLSLHAIAA